MHDPPKPAGQKAGPFIDVADPHDVARWALVLVVTANDIVRAVNAVGPDVTEVIRFLAERPS